MRGECPHCSRASAFLLVTNVYGQPGTLRWVAGLQCQACMKFILGVVSLNGGHTALIYEGHYPLGSPDETVANEVPEHIKLDFQEALRCQFVKAYNATAEMCRRALEASCIDLGVPTKIKVLEDMIDWLEKQRIITPHMQRVAHKIRLGGNRGAHPPPDGPMPLASNSEGSLEEYAPVSIIEKEHADAIVIFTREFFHHVYVVPKQLDKYDFSKPKPIDLPKVVT
jgi:hypothetical protein